MEAAERARHDAAGAAGPRRRARVGGARADGRRCSRSRARTRSGSGSPGRLAGVVAALVMALSPWWLLNSALGNSEGWLAAAVLWARARAPRRAPPRGARARRRRRAAAAGGVAVPRPLRAVAVARGRPRRAGAGPAAIGVGLAAARRARHGRAVRRGRHGARARLGGLGAARRRAVPGRAVGRRRAARHRRRAARGGGARAVAARVARCCARSRSPAPPTC